MRIVLLIVVCVLFAGCNRTTETDHAQDRPAGAGKASTKKAQGKSTPMQVVEGMTGKTAADAGRRAKATIEKVSAQEKEDLDEILGGNDQ